MEFSPPPPPGFGADRGEPLLQPPPGWDDQGPASAEGSGEGVNAARCEAAACGIAIAAHSAAATPPADCRAALLELVRIVPMLATVRLQPPPVRCLR